MNITQLELEELGKAIHYCLSGFKRSLGEAPYSNWEDSRAEHRSLCIKGAELISQNPGMTAENIHDFWITWAKQHHPDHFSIVSFEELSESEKIKDELCIVVVNAILKYKK